MVWWIRRTLLWIMYVSNISRLNYMTSKRNIQHFVFLLSRLLWLRGHLPGSCTVSSLPHAIGHFCLQLDFIPLFLLFYFKPELKVLCQWLMDQVPLGNKAPRPGYARQIWCPACRGLLEHPLLLTSGHVLLECMVVEGSRIGIFRIFGLPSLILIQVLAFVKGSELFLTNVQGLGGVKSLHTSFTSMGWIPVVQRYQSRFTYRGVRAYQNSLICGWALGVRRRGWTKFSMCYVISNVMCKCAILSIKLWFHATKVYRDWCGAIPDSSLPEIEIFSPIYTGTSAHMATIFKACVETKFI